MRSLFSVLVLIYMLFFNEIETSKTRKRIAKFQVPVSAVHKTHKFNRRQDVRLHQQMPRHFSKHKHYGSRLGGSRYENKHARATLQNTAAVEDIRLCQKLIRDVPKHPHNGGFPRFSGSGR
ncbi:uncharacterized protein LOC117171220 [Belonocnema kinseyi]|uniref:uncharacterized protein LOC117171220 n=1 Tax=Belonocnema kinseyi TaxID=2817044 RepID=UPI00143D420E|nr:uncharacterized protein LOC117171220 [Belonocnema kinseyi]